MMSISAAIALIERMQASAWLTDEQLTDILRRSDIEPDVRLLAALRRLRRAGSEDTGKYASKEKRHVE